MLHFRKDDLAAKILSMALPRKLFRIQPNTTIYEFSLHLPVFMHWSNPKYSLFFIKPMLPSTLLECLLLFKQISLSTTPHINQTDRYARNYLSSVIPIFSSLFLSRTKSYFSRFMLTDVGCLSAYLSTDLFLSTSTSYLGS